MTFNPVLSAAILMTVAVALIGARVVTLRVVLRRTAGRRRVRALLRWGALTTAVLLVLLAAARPTLNLGTAPTPTGTAADASNANVFFVVDRSVDSRVEDFGDGKPRMAGIRADVTTLIDHYPHARFAVISFSTRASMDWPLSDDVWSLKPRIAGLSADPPSSPDAMSDVNAAAASDLLRYKLYQAEQQFPGSKNLVFYLGQGGPRSRAPQGGFDLGSAKVSGGAVLGYGTFDGGPIPDQRSGNGFDTAGGPTGTSNSAISEPALKAIADQLGVRYLHRTSGQDITPVISAPTDVGGDARAILASGGARGTDLYWMLTLPAAALIFIEIWLIIRHFRGNRLAHRNVAL